jgi:hypothetical protein
MIADFSHSPKRTMTERPRLSRAIGSRKMRIPGTISTWGADALIGVAYGALGFLGIMLLLIGGGLILVHWL